MKVRLITLLVFLSLGGVLMAPLCAQQSGGAAGQQALPDDVDRPVPSEVKLIAQRAAMSALTGENPFVLRESSWSG